MFVRLVRLVLVSLFAIGGRRVGVAMVLGAALSLGACGGEHDRPAPPQGAASAPPAGAGPVPPAVAAEVGYAEVVALPLEELGWPADTSAGQVSVVAGPGSDIAVHDGEVRFLTPTDPGTHGEVSLRLAHPDGHRQALVAVRSSRPSAIEAQVEPDEAGAVPAPASVPALTVTGLGPEQALGPDALGFAVAGAPPLDPLASSATAFVPATGTTVDLAAHWTLDPATQQLVIPAHRMAGLLAALPSGDVEVDVGLTSADGEFAAAWSFTAQRPTARLQGQVVDALGAPQPAGAGRQVAVRGLDNRTRRVVTADGSGAFTVEALGAGTYELALLDTAAPGFWAATVAVYPDSTAVAAQLVFAPPVDPPQALARGHHVPGAMAQPATHRALASQDGRGPPPRAVDGGRPGRAAFRAAGPPPGCPAPGQGVADPSGDTMYQVTSADENATVGCVVAHAVPAGTAEVSVHLQVTSAEFPNHVRAGSRYNDTWSAAVSGLPGVPSAGGSVHETHATQGTVSRHQCVEVPASRRHAPWVLHARLAATNVGDAGLPTRVALTVRAGCEPALRVTSARFTSPDRSGRPVIAPRGGNLPGRYLSLPVATADAGSGGLPLRVTYRPRSAVLTGARIGVLVDGQPVMAPVDVLPAARQAAPGTLVFPNLVLPRMPLSAFPGKTSVVVALTGSVDGRTHTSPPPDGTVAFQGHATFTPLFLAGDEVGGARRFGQASPEPDGDSWATFDTLAWLKATPYRYNDVSARHVAQTPDGRSVLAHAGHSDGSQVDLRYADGQGGHGEALGGQGDGQAIRALLDAAATEARGATGPGGPGPQVAAAVAWVAANRALFERESPRARKLHAGPSWMKRALFDARFPDGSPMPGLQRWAAKPANLTFVAAHLNHWHVSLKDVPDAPPRPR